MDVYIGIDVACAKHKHLPLVMCYWENGRLLPFPLANYHIKAPQGWGLKIQKIMPLPMTLPVTSKRYVRTIALTRSELVSIHLYFPGTTTNLDGLQNKH